MRVIGICRFSYPALGGFKRMHDSVSEREAYLYDDARMALRFRHFETLTLPSLAAQKDTRFSFLVITGENMPDPWWSRLNDICATVPQIKIVTKPPMRHRTAMQLAIKEELAGTEDISMQFRLDDDDAVGIHFIRGLRRTARRSRRMREGWRNMAIEYRSGYSARLSADGISARAVQAPFWACGLAVLFQPGDPKTVMNYPHHKLHEVMPTLIDPSTPMFIRAVHGDNDSGASDSRLKPLTDTESADFKARFNVDETFVKAVFSGQAAPRDTV